MPSQLNISDYTLETAGNVQMAAGGDYFTIYATGLEALLSLRGQGCVVVGSGCAMLTLENSEPVGGTVTLQGGLAGQIKLGVGPPIVGALMVFEPEAISLSVGPPGVGASIKMTPESITFQVGEVSFMLTPVGIIEEVLECSREHTPEGHNFAAAETEMNVGVAGVLASMPMGETEAEAAMVTNQTLAQVATDAAKDEDAAILMVM